MTRTGALGLRGEDLAEVDEGLVVTITRSKGDQEGAGRQVGIPYGQSA